MNADFDTVDMDKYGNAVSEPDRLAQVEASQTAESIVFLPVSSAPTGTVAKSTPRRGVNLKTHAQLRREAAGVYRDVRAGRLPSAEGTRLIYILGQIGRLIEQGVLLSRPSEKTYEDYLREMHALIIADKARSLTSGSHCISAPEKD